jgi:hypothetical protein
VNETYRMPRREIVAQVTMLGEPSRELQLFLGLRARTHGGSECPSDLLNGTEPFVPARDTQGNTLLLRLDAVLFTTVSAQDESVTSHLEFQASDASSVDVAITLEGGHMLRGYVRYVLPEGQQRLQNYLRLPDRFLALYEGPRVHLVNKSRIVWVSCSNADDPELRLGASATPQRHV